MSDWPERLGVLGEELSQKAPTLLPDFHQAQDILSRRLSPQDMIAWAEAGLSLLATGPGSWQVASRFWRLSPRVLEASSKAHLGEWARVSYQVAQETPDLALAFVEASPETLPHLTPTQVQVWAQLGQSLHKRSPRFLLLANDFYKNSPQLLRRFGLTLTERLVFLIETLSLRSTTAAQQALSLAPAQLGHLEEHDREIFLGFLLSIAQQNWAQVKPCLEVGARLLTRLERDNRASLLSVAEKVARVDPSQVVPFFRAATATMRAIERENHSRLLFLTERVVAVGFPPVDFLVAVPTVLERSGPLGMEHWVTEGMRLMHQNKEAGRAFLRLESARAQEFLRSFSRGVELEAHQEVLALYCKALTGRKLRVHPTASLVVKGIGWTAEERPTTEGQDIYLPPFLDHFPTKEQNRAHYKVLATHQAGHLEFDSFEFAFSHPAVHFADRRQELRSLHGNGQLSDMAAFFNLFADRRLALEIFTIAEDTRVDSHLGREYRGIRQSYRHAQAHARSRRPRIATLPLQQALVETMLHLSLGARPEATFPQALSGVLEAIADILRRLGRPGAIVEDSAEATIRLYAILMQVPNLAPDVWQTTDLSRWGIGQSFPLDDGEFLRQALKLRSDFDDLAFQGMAQVDYRGSFKPELTQALMKLRNIATNLPAGQPLTEQQLKELLENNVEIEIMGLSQGEVTKSTGLFLTNLLREAGLKISASGAFQGQRQRPDGSPEEGGPLEKMEEAFTYPEWDFQAHDYRPDWCRLHQKVVEEGQLEFFEDTLRRYASLVSQLRRQFEQLRPDPFKKIKRLPDGEDFDLNAVIEAVVEKRAGRPPSEKLYWRRNKVEREVAVAFLLDMSASTDEDVDGGEQRNKDWAWIDEIWEQGWRPATVHLVPQAGSNKYRRIIDVEKESVVLLVEALEIIGDSYGVYGFSGYGRDNVEFFVVKDLGEELTEAVKRRVDKISPGRSTRMGAAIRHVTAKLAETPARLKILFLVSDGRPQDHDYGRDATEKDYAIHDTHMALVEARRKEIVPFCLTVDPGGKDYLKTMCADIGYEVLEDIEELPQVLPNLYRRVAF